jgi:hypothetical protein
MSNAVVQRIQQRAQITKGNIQRSLMRLNLAQRLEMTRREKNGVREALYNSIRVYADEQELFDFKTLAAMRHGLQIKGVMGIKKVSIVFARHGIFLETGAAPKTRNKKPIKHTTRTPKKWLSSVLPMEVEIYRQIVMEEYGAEIASGLRLVINGVFDSRDPNKYK